ncbi:MAG: ATP-binding cassette domain-containing protein [Ruminobacter sp.]|uniref:ATP-binding cassette domain-containing protein n=1 Tax=Ruminobacter sp. TaxID=2774296 RepID=UPI001B69C893|nr:ATP-binding cassette domain-containing protein [Ruminobacter sp.]MBP3749569.1 ATP-binding cassette domain-containing protein [Ruminobacter sp.]
MNNLVEIKDLSFSYGKRIIYENVSLEIPKGKITAFMGPSGTGKTTMLRLIGGQLVPDSGSVMFDGINVHKLSRPDLYSLRRRMSMLFQSGALFTDLNVFDNVAYPIREHTKLPEEVIRDMVLMKLEAVGLRGAAGLMPHELSGGMARRATLARSIALDPELIMYDEPFTGQDPITMAVLLRLIKTLNRTLGLTSVVVTHDVSEILTIADYAYILAGTKVVAGGTPEELKKSDDPRVRQFIKGEYDGPVPFNYPTEVSYLKDL